MDDAATAPGRPRPATGATAGGLLPLGLGVVTAYLGVLVLLPLAALTTRAFSGGWQGFWQAATDPQALAAMRLTLGVSAAAVAINAVMGTVIAWVLVRDRFPGRAVIDVLIDMPFALPTIVAGLTLLALYGPAGPAGVDIAFTRWGITLALTFVTLPFVVRAVQPVLMELDREMEEAAASLGASPLTTFRRIILPNLAPAILGGSGLAFGKALGEFGSVVLIAGNLPYRTEVASVYIFGQVESDGVTSAAAVSVMLLAAALVVLTAFGLLDRRVGRRGR